MKIKKSYFNKLQKLKTVEEKLFYLIMDGYDHDRAMEIINLKSFDLILKENEKINQAKWREKQRAKPFYHLIIKINKFKTKNNNIPIIDYTYEDVIKKFGEHPVCYLTGLPIDYSNGKNYHLDHIIPASKGGSNELDNMQITLKYPNYAKNDMSLNDLFQMCFNILKHNNKLDYFNKSFEQNF